MLVEMKAIASNTFVSNVEVGGHAKYKIIKKVFKNEKTADAIVWEGYQWIGNIYKSNGFTFTKKAMVASFQHNEYKKEATKWQEMN